MIFFHHAINSFPDIKQELNDLKYKGHIKGHIPAGVTVTAEIEGQSTRKIFGCRSPKILGPLGGMAYPAYEKMPVTIKNNGTYEINYIFDEKKFTSGFCRNIVNSYAIHFSGGAFGEQSSMRITLSNDRVNMDSHATLKCGSLETTVNGKVVPDWAPSSKCALLNDENEELTNEWLELPDTESIEATIDATIGSFKKNICAQDSRIVPCKQ